MAVGGGRPDAAVDAAVTAIRSLVAVAATSLGEQTMLAR
jgi:hypothetical protein